MTLNILTKEDLLDFKKELISEIKKILNNNPVEQKQWLRSSEVRAILRISSSTLQSFRINNAITYTKVGGTFFYKYEDIEKMLNK